MDNFQKDLLKVIDEKLADLYFEMRELDRKYIEKQKEVRLLKKRKEEYNRLKEQSSSKK
ncbi:MULTISPECIES: hypothetical protein [Bacillus]|uniref:hypothetical protein n=1 Tax=Bacillus TaxID=1386 RepID=UPI0009C3213F|nr:MULTISPECIES: hypothetical protein [Bacillus]ARC67226.1 hypothetical protein B14_200015 [Bacillus licheniformis]ARW46135.1 hypothetical protein S100141_04915 [Bacillus licheniformis]MCY8577165.1 hypothetical protein [Bacillus haynesii]MDE1421885.1 hypothetical protein [Bacillus licheniformis]MEC0475890.1 hypothetical protein [Bacillus licheniformis]